VIERRQCACRSWIESAPDEESIELAVQTHQRQPEHRDYVALEQLVGHFVAIQPLAQLSRVQMRRVS
jgi:hypothetical protein